MAERDYTNDYEDWLRNQPPPEQGHPEAPPIGGLAPGPSAPRGWMYDPNTLPTQSPPPGSFWIWEGDHWGTRPLPPDMSPNAGDPNRTTTPPPPPPSYEGGGGGGGGGFGYLTEPFMGRPPSYSAGPGWAAPTFTPPPPFSYKEFQAPTKDSIYADPSFEFRSGEGLKALGQHKASKGTYLTGGTLKDFVNYNQNAASQEYSNIFNRAVDTHNMGLQQALGTFGTNYGVSRDTYDRLFDASKAQYEAQERENVRMNNREFDSFLADFDIFERNRKRVGDYLFKGADYGLE